MKDLINEKLHLKDTIKIVDDVIVLEKEELEDLYKTFYGNIEELLRIAETKKIHINNLESSHDNPYFARIDFTYDKDNKKVTIYIGKNGVTKDNNIIITDWRAPISSLYYDAEIGKCSFEAPQGTISGEMVLKRQFEIENGELLDYIDIDLVSNDTLLQRYLNSNNDARLRSIVSTIQKEQNDVIRKKLACNLIVQGVAGSGKTTVALHRIAYLVYNHLKTIKQNQYLVIGPNPVFLKYIKSVLPDLDVSGVEQCTFEQFAQTYIDENILINSSDKKVIDYIAKKSNSDVDKFKCSIKYKEMIDKFLEVYLYSITSKPLMLGNFEVLPQKVIEEIFRETEDGYIKSLNNRIEIVIDRLCKYIEKNYTQIISNYNNYTYELFKDAKTEEEKVKMRKMFSNDRAELEKSCRSILRKYFSKVKANSTKLYKLFISTINDFDIYNYEQLELLKKITLKNIRFNAFDFEDLSALMYIKSVLTLNKDFNRIRHVIVDEAQDLGEFSFYILRNILQSATFSIFGDLAQSIYDYRSINNWDEVNNIMFDGTGEIVVFNKSYRTTAEIMQVADNVSDSIGLGKSDLVVRHGNPVEITSINESMDMPIHILKKIEEYINKGYKTIAVISKTDLLSRYINDDLHELGMSIPNINETDDLLDEKFRICTISNQLSKGLEFDAVIINGASENIYSSSNNLDMKLLYVAITRALHEVDIVYSGELTSPLKPFTKTRKK